MASTTVYRQLLRLARELDRNPMSKALIVASPQELFDRRMRAVVELPQADGALAECVSLLGGFNSATPGQTAEFYAPSRSAVDAVRRSRHVPLANDPIDVGLAALRALGVAVQGGEALQKLQPEAPWPQLPEAVRLRPGTTPKVGSLLLTHPVSCLAQPSLHHAVILLVSVSEEHILGLTVNKPFVNLDPSAPVAPLLGAAVHEAYREGLGVLRDAPLHLGGDVAPTSLLTLHSLGALDDSRAVSDGLWVSANLGEVRAAIEALPAPEQERPVGTPPPLGRLKCVVGHAGWAYEQLEAELRRNVWFLLEPDDGAELAPLALMQPLAPLPSDPFGSAWLRDALWGGAMERAGGEYLELGSFPGDHAKVREQMMQVEALQRDLLQKRLDLLSKQKEKERDGDGE